jgi:hypothetical protein
VSITAAQYAGGGVQPGDLYTHMYDSKFLEERDRNKRKRERKEKKERRETNDGKFIRVTYKGGIRGIMRIST